MSRLFGDASVSAHQQQQKKVIAALTSNNQHWFLWDTLSRTVGAVHGLKGGFSAACGLKVRAASAAGAGTFDLESLPVDMTFKDFLRSLLGSFLAHYLVLPGEEVRKQLIGNMGQSSTRDDSMQPLGVLWLLSPKRVEVKEQQQQQSGAGLTLAWSSSNWWCSCCCCAGQLKGGSSKGS
jgi:hypothetical protein